MFQLTQVAMGMAALSQEDRLQDLEVTELI